MDVDPSIVIQALEEVLVAFRLESLRSSRRSRTPLGSDVPRRTAMITSSADEHRRRRLMDSLQDTTAVTEYTVDLLLLIARTHGRCDGLSERVL